MRKKGQKWNYELLKKTALLYKTRGEFREGSKNAYNACCSRGILNEVCEHMEGTPYVKWSDEMLFAEAKKYKTRKEFRKANVSAFNACRRRGRILNKVYGHMKKPLHHKIPNCVYLIEIFTSNNELYYYVGQTSDLKNRLYRHFRYKKGSYSPVSDFLNKNPIQYKKHYIVKDNLTYKESIKIKRDVIEDLKDRFRGVNLLNKELI